MFNTVSAPHQKALLDRAAEAGINLIDTAECYGDHEAERLVGDYLSRHERDRWIIATKFGHRFNGFMDRTDGFGAGDVRAQLIASLRALRTDRIDLYQFHSGSDEAFLDEGLRTFLEDARRAGMVRNLGVSVRGAGSKLQTREAFGRGYGVLQIVYNRLDNRAESETFPTAGRYNLGILARVPLASGLLSGTHEAGDTFGPDDYRSTLGKAEITRRIRQGEKLADEELPSKGAARAIEIVMSQRLKARGFIAVVPGTLDLAELEGWAGTGTRKARGVLVSGGRDPHYDRFIQIKEMFEKHQVPLMFENYPEMAHQIPNDFESVLQKGLKFILNENARQLMLWRRRTN